MILQFMENICQRFTVMPDIILVILAFTFSNELGLVAYTFVFTCLHKKV